MQIFNNGTFYVSTLILMIIYFFRANNMVDVMSTRLHEVYAKWESRTEVPRNLESNTPRLSLGGKSNNYYSSDSKHFLNEAIHIFSVFNYFSFF